MVAKAESAIAQASGPAALSQAHPISILVVGDQPHSVVALDAALANVDWGLVKAQSIRDALKCVLAQDFAVIVVDVHTSGMDAFETASLIRAQERSHSTPIVFLTDYDPDGTRIPEGYRLGAVDFMYKPFDADNLRSKLTFFVDLYRKTVALEQRNAVLAVEIDRSKEHFHALIENVSDLILIIDKNAQIRYASPSVERVLGYSREQLSGQRVAAFLHPDDVISFHSDIALLLRRAGANPPKEDRAIACCRTLPETEGLVRH